MSMIVEPRHLEIVKEILNKYPYNFYAYGSRVKGNARKFSDLDICFMDNIPWNVRSHIDEDFEESDLPFIVEIVDWKLCDEEFRNLIKPDLTCIQQAHQ